MDKLTHARTLLMDLLSRHANLINRSSESDLETYTIFDEARDHYLLFRVGWLGKERIHTPVLYIRIHDGKFWIEEDYTEDGIATELLAAGVPHQAIVLAFRHPALRPYTEFAVA